MQSSQRFRVGFPTKNVKTVIPVVLMGVDPSYISRYLVQTCCPGWKFRMGSCGNLSCDDL